MTPFGHRILPLLARVRDGFSLHVNQAGVEEVFEVPLAFLMTSQNHKRESRAWNTFTLGRYSMSFGDRNIWGATAGAAARAHAAHRRAAEHGRI